MTDNYIQLKKKDILRFGIRDENGKETGEYLEFNLKDIELPLKYQELLEKDKKNREWARNQIAIINKRQDVQGKKLLTKNQEDEIKVIIDFFKKETEIYNMFLGENGVQKILNGRKFEWDTLEEIDEIIDKIIAPKLQITKDKLKQQIIEKYNNAVKRNEAILK